jgi:glutamate 5-kinase
VIRGGMVPKAESAVEALKDGVQSVHIISGKKPSTLLAEVFTETGSGTMIHRNGGAPVKGKPRKGRERIAPAAARTAAASPPAAAPGEPAASS